VDKTTIPGIAFGIGCILLGQKLEGGHAGSLLQATAFLIVVGGTIGAVMVSYPLSEVIGGVKGFGVALKEKPNDIVPLMAQLVELATVARRDGVLALEATLAEIKDPFLKRALGFLVDGVEASVRRRSRSRPKKAAWSPSSGATSARSARRSACSAPCSASST
jgi:chemotaxis protein MotA